MDSILFEHVLSIAKDGQIIYLIIIKIIIILSIYDNLFYKYYCWLVNIGKYISRNNPIIYLAKLITQINFDYFCHNPMHDFDWDYYFSEFPEN